MDEGIRPPDRNQPGDPFFMLGHPQLLAGNGLREAVLAAPIERGSRMVRLEQALIDKGARPNVFGAPFPDDDIHPAAARSRSTPGSWSARSSAISPAPKRAAAAPCSQAAAPAARKTSIPCPISAAAMPA